ncbi:MAG: hypothetical protein RIS05_792 [Actinomycetota bacterium]|jgi:FlaG/FlaF family flagellin (archaellin)
MSSLGTHQLSIKSPRVIVAGTLFLAALLSSFAFAYLADSKSNYWVAAHPIAAGTVLTSEDIDLVSASLVDNRELYLEEESSPIGLTSTQNMVQGGFLSIASLTEDSQNFDSEQVPLNIAPSDIPSTIQVGEMISLYWVPEPANPQSLSTPELLLTGIFLRSIDRKGSNFGSGLPITVSVDNSQVLRLLAGTSNGRLVVVRSNG